MVWIESIAAMILIAVVLKGFGMLRPLVTARMSCFAFPARARHPSSPDTNREYLMELLQENTPSRLVLAGTTVGKVIPVIRVWTHGQGRPIGEFL